MLAFLPTWPVRGTLPGPGQLQDAAAPGPPGLHPPAGAGSCCGAGRKLPLAAGSEPPRPLHLAAVLRPGLRGRLGRGTMEAPMRSFPCMPSELRVTTMQAAKSCVAAYQGAMALKA